MSDEEVAYTDPYLEIMHRIEEGIAGLAGAIKTEVADVLDGVVSTVDSITEFLPDFYNDTMYKIEAVTTAIGNKIDSAIGGIGEAFENVFGQITGSLAELKERFGSAIENIGEQITGGLSNVATSLTGAMKSVGAFFKDGMSSLLTSMVNFGNVLEAGIKATASKIYEGFGTFAANLVNGFANMVDNLDGFFTRLGEGLKNAMSSLIAYLQEMMDELVRVLGLMGEWFENLLDELFSTDKEKLIARIVAMAEAQVEAFSRIPLPPEPH